MLNFIKKEEKKIRKIKKKVHKFKNWKKIIFIFIFSIILFCVGSVVWAAINIGNLKLIYSESLAAKQSFEYAQADLGEMNFTQAKINLDEANAHFELAKKKFSRFKIFKVFPGLNPQIKAVANILQAGSNLSSGLSTLTDVADQLNKMISDKNKSFAEISKKDRKAVLKRLYESNADLQGVKAEVEMAAFLIDDIPEHGLLGPINDAVAPLKEQLPTLEAIIYQAIPLAQVIPKIAGYPEATTCLFFLQNNNELRPTGGFLGTYGELTLDAGDLSKLYTENVYVLDEKNTNKITEPAPLPLQQQTKTAQAFLRNENWWPDFPTSARKMESKFIEEGGNPDVSCVMVINIPFIVDLMGFTGPIKSGDQEFNQENLFAALQHQVEFGYYEEGLNPMDRKDVIGDIGGAMVSRLYALPQSEFPALWETFKKNANEKHIQIYYNDSVIQSLISELNWAGEMQNYDSDYVMVVDANVSALKTDEVMERELTHKVYEENGQYLGETSMLYRNNGSFTKIHTRYRTYTRIYLPQGAQLIDYSGYLTGDKLQNGVPTAPEVYDESFDKPDGSKTTYTVVAGFIAIEPQATGTLWIKYVLPASVTDDINNKNYSLYVQKQGGTLNHKLNFSFDIGQKIENASGLDLTPEIRDNNVSLTTDLLLDRKLNIMLK
ncbi:MAG: hypothetical protein A2233_00330 [Candidatus Kerfeldbacteria bacterium RIFOXYA2_FULL_38_24]|uniref:DUF4012 domain-containing protein n=1 Tax=Candidatus Kerfeldbacteria bacterium RIFOXYB2_FULL_38_14 TaxID=1798547 RepID=A0A1G2BAA6_9BACT|nr:MAG: hypothetical protein A2233_00330 [Candidatus Kerfeldbacteria bacterium RIFOXYA2_FULL_38_24]OGY86042.1 MAG: hypothetical protein A2319_00535 [Candidatus Kerfeldbacteria bacterium RIFOXYB2_FULL_38_14]